MTMTSLAAKNGVRYGVLGSAADLAEAAPLAAGNLAPTAHTDASRIGRFFDRTPGLEKITHVIMGVTAMSVTASGIIVPATALPGAPATGQIVVDSGDSNKLKWWDGAAWQAAGGTATIGGTIAATQVAYGSGANTIAGSNNMTYDATLGTGGLAIANTTPAASTITGALKVAGGVGIVGKTYIGAGADVTLTNTAGYGLGLTVSNNAGGGTSGGAFIDFTYNYASGSAALFARALVANATLTPSASTSITNAAGIQSALTISPSGTAALVMSSASALRLSLPASSITTAATLTVTSMYGIWLADSALSASGGGSGTVTDFYALYVGTLTASGITVTNRYGVYQADAAATNIFSGRTELRGSSSPYLYFNATGAGANAKLWRISALSTNLLEFETRNDADAAGDVWLRVAKTPPGSGVVSVTFPSSSAPVIVQCSTGTISTATGAFRVTGGVAIGERLAVGAGTAANPAIFFDAENTTGFWRQAANVVSMSFSGTERARLSGSTFYLAPNAGAVDSGVNVNPQTIGTPITLRDVSGFTCDANRMGFRAQNYLTAATTGSAALYLYNDTTAASGTPDQVTAGLYHVARLGVATGTHYGVFSSTTFSAVTGPTILYGGRFVHSPATNTAQVYGVSAEMPSGSTTITTMRGFSAVLVSTSSSAINHNLYFGNLTLNQSGTAGYEALVLAITETATGSGTKNLIRASVGGANRFVVANTGQTSLGADTGYALNIDSDGVLASSNVIQMRRNNALGGGWQFTAASSKPVMWYTSPSYTKLFKVGMTATDGTGSLVLGIGVSDPATTDLGIVVAPTTGNVSLTSTTAASSATNAALVVAGGIGTSAVSIFQTTGGNVLTLRAATGGTPTGDGTVLTISEGASPNAGNNRGVFETFTAIQGGTVYTIGNSGFRTGSTWTGGAAADRDGVFVVQTRVNDTLADRLLVDGAGNVAIVGPGAAATPALYLDADTTTGFFRQAANVVSMSFSGTEQIRLGAASMFMQPTTALNVNAAAIGTDIPLTNSSTSSASLRSFATTGSNTQVAAVFRRAEATSNAPSVYGVYGMARNTAGDGTVVGVYADAQWSTAGGAGVSRAIGLVVRSTTAVTTAGKTSYGIDASVTATGASNASSVIGLLLATTAAASSASAQLTSKTLTIPSAFTGTTVRGIGVTVSWTGTASTTASTVRGIDLALTVNQNAATAIGYTAILANVTETAVGTAAKLLLDLQVGAITKFSVNNAGTVTSAGGRVVAVRSITSAAGTTALAVTDHFVCVTGVTTETLTLPAAANGQWLLIKNRSSGAVTVNRAGADTLDGGTTYNLVAGSAIMLIANGTDWTIN